MNRLSETLEKAGISAEVKGRPKHIYSIWKKMQRKGLDFHQLFDVRAVRVLVDDLPACYSALGLVHSLWQPIPGEFDDYITTPKGNNYQSLHTAVADREGRAVEIQIRTREMHEHAELGVAAHWRYKEGGPTDPAFDNKIAIMRQLLDSSDEDLDDQSLLDSFQSATSEDRVYVLGHSMGGAGSWNAIWANPGMFAAAIPSAGGLTPGKDRSNFADLPIWAFHGSADTIVPTDFTREIFADLKKLGGNMKYTELQGVKHNASTFGFEYEGDDEVKGYITQYASDRCDKTPGVWDWLFRQKRNAK